MRLVIVQNILRDYNHWMFRDLAAITGLEVIVVFGESPAENRKFGSVSNISIPHRRLPTRQLVLKEMLLSQMVGLYDALAELAPDVILVEGESNFLNNGIVRRFSKEQGVPYMWWSMGSWTGAPTWTPRRRVLHHCFGVGRQLRDAAVVVAYSNGGAAYYRRLGVPEEKIRVAINVLSDVFWQPVVENAKPAVPAVRERLGLEGRISLCTTGTLTPGKRADEFIRFFELARDASDLPEIVGVVMGDGPERQSLEERATTGSLPIHFVGWQDRERASEILLACDASVSLGNAGLNLSQALIHGRPILAAPADGTELDLIRDYENGLLLPCGTAEDLLGGMRSLLARGCNWRDMGEASLRRHRETYNIAGWAHSIASAAELARGQAREKRIS